MPFHGANKFAKHHGIKLIIGNEDSLLAATIQKRLEVVLPDESVIGEPFYCLKEKGESGQITGTLYSKYRCKWYTVFDFVFF